MLEQLLGEIHNWFQTDIYPDTYTISEGDLELPFLKDGQYFRILGSVFNDGLHRYGPDMKALKDETFLGSVWALAVPPAVLELSEEIESWQKKYGEKALSPYASESFGGYSYAKAAGPAEINWQTVFRDRLKQWRKLREL